MAKIIIYGFSFRTGILSKTMLYILLLMTARLFAGDTYGTWPWRPASPPNLAVEPNEAKAAELIKRLSYTESDTEFLFDITLFLPPEESTGFLKKYIKEYSSVSDLTSISWVS